MNDRNEKRHAKRRTLGLLSAAVAGAIALTLPGASIAKSKGALRIGYQKYGTLTIL
jgi:sulfonate transport system substrate-binding protein